MVIAMQWITYMLKRQTRGAGSCIHSFIHSCIGVLSSVCVSMDMYVCVCICGGSECD
jgi:hypothetical protein